ESQQRRRRYARPASAQRAPDEVTSHDSDERVEEYSDARGGQCLAEEQVERVDTCKEDGRLGVEERTVAREACDHRAQRRPVHTFVVVGRERLQGPEM